MTKLEWWEPTLLGTYEIPLQTLITLPTLCVSQADNLKIETETKRVWLSRTGIEDGEPCDNKVTIEILIDERWITVEYWEAI